MQDRASTAALNKKIALTQQDIKRLSKSVGELEEDVDTMRYGRRSTRDGVRSYALGGASGLIMAIRKKLKDLETLQASGDANEDAMKDKAFVRTLRARLQLMATDLESKASRSDLNAKADVADIDRLSNMIRDLKRSGQLLPDGDTQEPYDASEPNLSAAQRRGTMNVAQTKKPSSIRGRLRSNANAAGMRSSPDGKPEYRLAHVRSLLLNLALMIVCESCTGRRR